MLPYRFQTRSNLIAAKCCTLDPDGNYKLRSSQRNQGRWHETRRGTATQRLWPLAVCRFVRQFRLAGQANHAATPMAEPDMASAQSQRSPAQHSISQMMPPRRETANATNSA
jgi:hypothetical protein